MLLVKYSLVVGIGMDSGHQTFHYTKTIVQYFGGGSQGIGSAGGVRDNMVSGRIVFILIHTQDYSDIFILGRGGNDDLFGATLPVSGSFGSICKESGGLNDNINTEVLPFDGCRVTF